MASNPTIEVIIRDEVSAALERQRQRLRGVDARTSFSKTKQEWHGLEEAGRKLNQEFGSLLRLSGIGAFLGGGLVAGLSKLTQALGGVARASEQSRYLADQLGITSQKLGELSARGQALGMTSEQTKAGLSSLLNNLRELKVLGPNAAIFKQLAETGGASGERFARQLMASVRGPGGYDAAVRLFVERMGGMNKDAQAKLSEVFGLGSVAFRDLYSKGLEGLPRILELPEGAARRLNIANANLNISFDNLKTTLGGAMLPAFEQLTRTLDRFLQGPGGKVVAEFAAWAKSINIDWGAIGRALAAAVDLLRTVFVGVKKAFDEMNPIVEKMGGWSTVLGTLALAIGVGGLAGALTGVGGGLKLIGQFAWVIPAFAGLIAVSGGAQGAGAGAGAPGTGGAGGGGTGTPGGTSGGPLELPEIENEGKSPTVPTPRPRPIPRSRMSGGGLGSSSMPRLAQLTSGGPGKGGYYIPGADDEGNAEELNARVRGMSTQVTRLASLIGAEALTTDDSGAGGLAALGGRIRGGGFGGGGGRSPGGGGGGGSSASTGPRETGNKETPPRFATVRLNNPGAATAPAGTPHRKMAETFGSKGGQHLPGGGYTPAFPSPVHGAAFNMWFLTQKKWVGRTVSDIIWEWSGHSRRWAVGFTGNEVLTIEKLADQDFMVKLAKGIAAGEAPGKYPMDQAQWEQAFKWYKNGGVPEGEKALPRIDPVTGKPLAPGQQPTPTPTSSTTTPPTTGTGPIETTGAMPSPVSGELWQGPGAARRGHTHAGQDIGAPEGTPIYSMGPGVVVRSGFQGGITGGIVVVKYANGIEAKYMHLSNWDIWRITNGGSKIAKAGMVIGLVGHTGARGIKDHLHVEYRDAQGRLLRPADVHGYGAQNQSGEGLHGRKVYAGQPGSYAPGETPVTEKDKQEKAQRDFDEYLRKQKEKETATTTPTFAQRARGGRINLKINVRGPRGVRVSSDSTGDVGSATINREMDPSGGVTGHSPG